MTEKEFEHLIYQSKDKLYRFAYRILNCQEEAKDAVQEVVLRLWMRRQKLNTERNIESLCMTMLKNYCIDQLRKQKQLQLFQENRENNKYDRQNFEQIDLVEQLRQQLTRLPLQQQIALHLKDFQGLDYEEISQIMQIPVNAIRVHVSRGRKKLGSIFKAEYTK